MNWLAEGIFRRLESEIRITLFSMILNPLEKSILAIDLLRQCFPLYVPLLWIICCPVLFTRGIFL